MQYNAQGQASSVVARVAQASINVKSPGATVTFSAAQAGTVGYSVANKITVTAPALTGANVWVCAAAEDDPSAYGLITSYIGVNDMDPDGYSAPTAGYAVGFQTSSGACLTQDQYSYQNPWAGEAVAINTGGATLVKLADSESDGNNGCGGLCQTMGLPVNVSTAMPVVIALSCGYESACDPAGYGSITGIPSGCVGTTQDTPDTGATVAIYTCNSVSSNFNVIINAPSGLPDDMAMIAYGLEK